MKKFSVLFTLIAILLMVGLSACTGTEVGKTADSPASNLFNKLALNFKQSPIESAEILATQQEEGHSDSTLQTNPSSFLDETTFVEIYQQVNPSVVNIQATIKLDSSGDSEEATPSLPDIPNLPDFPQFPFPEIPHLQPRPQQGQGSGFVYDEAGHIITNYHVVAAADEITVVFADGTEATATIVGTDPDTDLAVIKVQERDVDQLVPAVLGDSSNLQIGQFVVAIGNPFGLSGSMTTGIISGLGRILPADATRQFSIPDIIQTDAAINPGNSGGPLLNLEGQVIGVNTAITSPYGAFAGVGYAVPVNSVLDVVPELITNGRVEHPWLGIAGRTLDRQTAEAMELDSDQRGILIVEVVANSPAFESNLQGSDIQVMLDGQQVRIGGDVIVGIDDVDIVEFDDLLSYIIHETEVGQSVTLHLLRDGEPLSVDVTLTARPANNQ